MASNVYIGAPNGIVLCINDMDERGCIGKFYHAYSKKPVSFESLGEMLFKMESFFDRLDFPRRGNNARHFTETVSIQKAYKEKIMSDKELLEKHGQQQTFIVRVQHRQNNTWQGQITWAEKNKKLNFRSIWEMVHMMENALYEEIPQSEIPQVRSWEEP